MARCPEDPETGGSWDLRALPGEDRCRLALARLPQDPVLFSWGFKRIMSRQVSTVRHEAHCYIAC